ncbi:7-carboxy-7-deazaguanine synthase [Pullulanibacillus pueri]|uniref:7-carboxy-7-deazaguanine synthase n=1 Tax=Pullulanibacillus pueri TaxID=1437324 RepID=A0A8J3EM97_9BACL|nr:7-carboxy-7-deazaguanine synthase QueE [Pullulanibacillus pueri]MBM7682575.1 7-carboxy-7-deazaguanine synthase [Pullulanibacillus pueri]GGH82361.1 7-carboxy-7-deazaguanine synthase [Pullulanibacillus pueri]
MSKLPVLEIFGPTIQGEGMVIGRKTMFVRTAGCDYRCSWCDSAFTWDGSAKQDIRQLTPEAIWEELVALGGDCFDHVTISGGNPALLAAVADLVQLFKTKGIKTALETQGSRWQPWMTAIDDLTLSPKPPSSGMKTHFSVLDSIIEQLLPIGNASLKVVIFDEADFDYAVAVHERYKGIPFFLQVGNADTTTTNQEALTKQLMTRYEWLIDKAMVDPKMNDVRILPQIHTLVWGNKRGV